MNFRMNNFRRDRFNRPRISDEEVERLLKYISEKYDQPEENKEPKENKPFEESDLYKAPEEFEEPDEPVPHCQICDVHEIHGGQKDFPSGLQFFFLNCERCGRLCCNGCISGSSLAGYNIVCNPCYDEVTEQEAREREEYWREREEEEKTFEE